MHPQDRALLCQRRIFSNWAGGHVGINSVCARKKSSVLQTHDPPLWPLTSPRPQSIQPTANLDRTDDLVYLNVMELVRAVLDLKNELCQLPPEGYVVVVKVRAVDGAGGGCSFWPWAEGRWRRAPSSAQ